MIRTDYDYLTDMLPTWAVHAGYSLVWYSPRVMKADPVILTRHNEELYRWNYIPSMREVWDKLGELKNA